MSEGGDPSAPSFQALRNPGSFIMVADPPKGLAAAEPIVNGVPALVPKEDPDAAGGSNCSSGDQVRRCLRANLLVLVTVVAVVAGLALGLGMSAASDTIGLNPSRMVAFAFPGELLLRMLRMIILPLVVCSLISGAASLDPSALGRLGAWALLFFLVTTLLASALGVSLALAVQPGAALAAMNSSARVNRPQEEAQSKEVLDSFLDLLRSDPAHRRRVGEGYFSHVGREMVATCGHVDRRGRGGFGFSRARTSPGPQENYRGW